MEGVREYLLSVTAGAMLCGVLKNLVGEKGALSGLYRLICGLFLCFLVISPLAQVSVSDFQNFTGDILEKGRQAADAGEEANEATLRQIITDETRAYIMDKAQTYGADIQVEVVLSEDDPPVPKACTITGSLSPYARQQLKKILIQDLGIPEEKHVWIQ